MGHNKKKKSNKSPKGQNSLKSVSSDSSDLSCLSDTSVETIKKLSPANISAFNQLIDVLRNSDSDDDANLITDILQRVQSAKSGSTSSNNNHNSIPLPAAPSVPDNSVLEQVEMTSTDPSCAIDVLPSASASLHNNNNNSSAVNVLPSANVEPISVITADDISDIPSLLGLSESQICASPPLDYRPSTSKSIVKGQKQKIAELAKNQCNSALNYRQLFPNSQSVRDARRNESRIQTRSKSSNSRSEQQDAARNRLNRPLNVLGNSDFESSTSNANDDDDADYDYDDENVMDTYDDDSDDAYAINASQVSKANATRKLPTQATISQQQQAAPAPTNAIPVSGNNQNVGNTNKTSDPKSPQIWIKFSGKFEELIGRIDKQVNRESYSIKLSGSNQIRFNPRTIDSYRGLIQLFSAENIEYHTYQPRSERSLRIVIRGIHFSTPINSVKIAISDLGFSVRSVYLPVFKNNRGTGTFSPNMFFIELEPNNENNTKIFELTSLCNFQISVEWRRKNDKLIQCMRCQKFNHTAKYCHKTPMCVKCGKDHLTRTCTKSEDVPAKCGNCQGDHTANYGGCPYYLKLLSNKTQATTRLNSNAISLPNQRVNQNQNQTRAQTTQPHVQQHNSHQAINICNPQTARANHSHSRQQQHQQQVNIEPPQPNNHNNNNDKEALNSIFKLLDKHSNMIGEIQCQMKELYKLLTPTVTPNLYASVAATATVAQQQSPTPALSVANNCNSNGNNSSSPTVSGAESLACQSVSI